MEANTERLFWSDYLEPTLNELIERNNIREFGKFVQQANEIAQQDWINKNTGLQLKRHIELTPSDLDHIKLKHDHNEGGWDMICMKTGIRIQSKYRGGQSIHLEQTRRVSDKNKGAASRSGHVAYSAGEFDVLVVTRPSGPAHSVAPNTDFIIIPEKFLRDPKNPGFLVRAVPKGIEKEWARADKVALLNKLKAEKVKSENS